MSCLQRNKILMLIITNECNLNCSYCYQEHREKNEKEPKKVSRKEATARELGGRPRDCFKKNGSGQLC